MSLIFLKTFPQFHVFFKISELFVHVDGKEIKAIHYKQINRWGVLKTRWDLYRPPSNVYKCWEVVNKTICC